MCARARHDDSHDEELHRLLFHVARGLRRQGPPPEELRAAFRSAGLGPRHVGVLAQLATDGPLTVGELAERLRVYGRRPTRRPHIRSGGQHLRFLRRRTASRFPGRPVRRRGARCARRRRSTARDHGPRPRHGGGRAGPTFLDPCGVDLVPEHGLGRGQHDAVPGSRARGRSGDPVCRRRARDRLRHRPPRPSGIEPVSQEQVFAFFDANAHRIRDLLLEAIPDL